jgi:hypothetical protein
LVERLHIQPSTAFGLFAGNVSNEASQQQEGAWDVHEEIFSVERLW